jgi:hypothetical protein
VVEARRGPPPLAPFGLQLHHDGVWSHDGQPIANQKLREHFDRSVRYLPDEGKYVVTLKHFRGEIVLEEAGFFVLSVDLRRGRVGLSDGSEDALDISSLRGSAIDGAWLCTVKRDLVVGGLAARVMHPAQSELMAAVEQRRGEVGVEVAGEWRALPELD